MYREPNSVPLTEFFPYYNRPVPLVEFPTELRTAPYPYRNSSIPLAEFRTFTQIHCIPQQVPLPEFRTVT